MKGSRMKVFRAGVAVVGAFAGAGCAPPFGVMGSM
jgi:hypothetical protein